MGTKYNRFAGQDRFGRILPALREQTFPDEGKCRHAIPIVQFTGRIDKQTIEKWIGSWRLTSKRDMKSDSFQLATNFGGPFGVSRRQNQKKIDKVPSQSTKHFGQNLLFSIMRAASKNHRAFFQAKAGKNSGRYLRVDFCVLRIVLDAAKVTNSVRFSAERFPSLNIFWVLNVNGVEQSKSRRDKTAEHPKPFLGPRR